MDDSIKSMLAKAREHYRRKEFAAAGPFLERVVAEGGAFADVHNMLGVIHHDAGDLARAREQFEAALRINPNYTEAILNLTVTYNETGRYDDAKKLMEHLGGAGVAGSSRLEPFAKGKIANLHADVSQAYHDVGLMDEAIAEMSKAIGLCPEFADLHVRLGNLLTEAQRPSEAFARYQEAVRLRPDYLQAKIHLGIAHHKAGRRAEAVDCWRSVLEKDPASRSARMYLRLAGEPVPDPPDTSGDR